MAIGVTTTVVSLAVVVNVVLYGFYSDNFAVAFGLGGKQDPALDAARSALVVSQILIAPVVALGLLILAPAVSRVSPAARIAGASRVVIAVGEMIPVLLAIVVVISAGGVGPTWFVSSRQSSPGVAMVALTSTAVGAGLTAVAVFSWIVTLLRAARASPALARLVALIGSFALAGVLLGDLLEATATSKPSSVLGALEIVWGGSPLALDVRSAIGGAFLMAMMVAATLGARVCERDDGAFPRLARIAGIRSIGAPGSLGNAVVRESLMLLRHPIGQTTTAASAALCVLVVIANRGGLMPSSIALPACAMLFSASAETSFGRSVSWLWVRRLTGQPAARTVAEQYVGALPVGLVGVIAAASAIIVPAPGDVPSKIASLLATVILFAGLSALAYSAGVLLPFDDAAPTAVVGTSLLTLSLEGIVMWVSSWVAPSGGLRASALDCVFAAAALALGTVVLLHREAALRGNG
jgi:hypothetical protein